MPGAEFMRAAIWSGACEDRSLRTVCYGQESHGTFMTGTVPTVIILVHILQKSGDAPPSFTSELIEQAEKAGRLHLEEDDIRYAAGAMYAGRLTPCAPWYSGALLRCDLAGSDTVRMRYMW